MQQNENRVLLFISLRTWPDTTYSLSIVTFTHFKIFIACYHYTNCENKKHLLSVFVSYISFHALFWLVHQYIFIVMWLNRFWLICFLLHQQQQKLSFCYVKTFLVPRRAIRYGCYVGKIPFSLINKCTVGLGVNGIDITAL